MRRSPPPKRLTDPQKILDQPAHTWSNAFLVSALESTAVEIEAASSTAFAEIMAQSPETDPVQARKFVEQAPRVFREAARRLAMVPVDPEPLIGDKKPRKTERAS